jgi:cellulose synthase/poly-beta-1,6-N-acetylglucosamine synthase-like glycosyltransferase
VSTALGKRTAAVDEHVAPVVDEARLGEWLVGRGLLTQSQLLRALRAHHRSGVRLGETLINLGFTTEDEVGTALASQTGTEFVDLRVSAADPRCVRLLHRDIARLLRVLPLRDEDGTLIVGHPGVPDEAMLAELRALLDRPVRMVVVSASAFDETLDKVYRDEFLDQAASYLLTRSPEDSARWVLSRPQQAFLLALLVTVGIGFALRPVLVASVAVLAATLVYTVFCAYKVFLAVRALTHFAEIEVTAEEVTALSERDLPVYTLLIPAYHEAAVFPTLVRAIERLDYPKAKLDVKILLEEDDLETIEVARASDLPSHFRLVVVPKGQPKGKPKACNYGLIYARGEYVVIYDVEDIPDPDQLKKALVVFHKGGEQLACVQAKLNYFNADQNLLTRWFAGEYSMWFDLFLPGLHASRAPIPLGGTSNHFRLSHLREVGAWDPYNVTEDADLGMRLYKAGGRTAVVDSSTYEEANADTYNWIRQRSRWVKGYIQTYLVHMRNPVRLYRAIGPRGFLSFQCMVGGTPLVLLLNPVFWLLTLAWVVSSWVFIKEIFPAPVFYLGSIALYFGNFTFAYLNTAGCLRRGYHDLVKFALLSPVYWVLMSLAAWKGFLQLFYAPSYWEKTRHGLSTQGLESAFQSGGTPPREDVAG